MRIIRRLSGHPRATVRLFCFPYAGGGASVFQPWVGLPAEIDVYAIQLPGREERFDDALASNMEDILEELEVGFSRYVDRPFAFFGHSMGAMICWEFARRLHRTAGVAPVHIFVSGARSLQCSRDSDLATLSDPELVEHMRGMSGAPARVLENTELMSILVRQLRADARLAANYRYEPGDTLPCPISAFGGSDDENVDRTHLEAWSALTTGPIDVRMFPGDHFFLHSARDEVLGEITRVLTGP